MIASTPARRPESRLIHRGLGRAEFFDLGSDQFAGLHRILAGLRMEGRTKFSFHAPVIRPEYFPYDGTQCFFLSEDGARRRDSFRVLNQTLSAARDFGADYTVTHLTYGKTDTLVPQTARRLAREACDRFAASSREAGVPLDVEFAGYTDSFHEVDAFLDAVGPHVDLGVCIDIGHAFLGALRRRRDYLADVAALAPRARSMHLWNTTGPECYARHHHVPLHPSQSPNQGWIDVPAVMQTVLAHNPAVHIIFEYPVESITPHTQEGYDWVAALAGRPGSEPTGATPL